MPNANIFTFCNKFYFLLFKPARLQTIKRPRLFQCLPLPLCRRIKRRRIWATHLLLRLRLHLQALRHRYQITLSLPTVRLTLVTLATVWHHNQQPFHKLHRRQSRLIRTISSSPLTRIRQAVSTMCRAVKTLIQHLTRARIHFRINSIIINSIIITRIIRTTALVLVTRISSKRRSLAPSNRRFMRPKRSVI